MHPARCLILLTAWLLGCPGDSAVAPEAETQSGADAELAGGACTLPAADETTTLKTGLNRLYAQGSGGETDDDGRFPLLADRRFVVEGDHFIMNAGSFVEMAVPWRDTLTGQIAVHIARDDDPGVIARYEVLTVRGGVETLVGTCDDADPGHKGRTPYDAVIALDAPLVPGDCDELMLRITNLTGGTLGVVIVPPDYMSWIDVTVPAADP